MKKLPITLIALLAAGIAVVGCGNTAEGVAEDTSKNVNAVANAPEKVANAAANAGEAVANTASAAVNATTNAAANAGEAVANGASAAVNATANAGEAVANAGTATVVTGAVKLAITANPDLNADGNTINVDTKDGKIVLRGKVKTEALKKTAEEIAMKVKKDKGFSETVVNQLTVGM